MSAPYERWTALQEFYRAIDPSLVLEPIHSIEVAPGLIKVSFYPVEQTAGYRVMETREYRFSGKPEAE